MLFEQDSTVAVLARVKKFANLKFKAANLTDELDSRVPQSLEIQDLV